jgi:hypothetical protein
MSPLRQGATRGPIGGDRLLSQQGTRGARLTLKGGGGLLIGSERAEELAEAIGKVGR